MIEILNVCIRMWYQGSIYHSFQFSNPIAFDVLLDMVWATGLWVSLLCGGSKTCSGSLYFWNGFESVWQSVGKWCVSGLKQIIEYNRERCMAQLADKGRGYQSCYRLCKNVIYCRKSSIVQS